MAHSRLSPSSAPRYLRCLAAPQAEEGLPDVTSVFAAEGTLLHHVAEECLVNAIEPYEFVGKTYVVPHENDLYEITDLKRNYHRDEECFVFTITKDHADCMIADLHEIRVLVEDGEMHVESRVKLDFPLGKGEAGTVDLVIRDWRGEIWVCDWKFGAGVLVDPEENEQLKLYALGAVALHFPEMLQPGGDHEDDKIHIKIMQPRAPGGGGTWTTTFGELWDWGREVQDKVEIINGPNPPFTPGEKQCKWCKARKGDPDLGVAPCAARENYLLKAVQTMFPDLDTSVELDLPGSTVKVSEIDATMRVWLLDHSKMIKEWLEDLHEHIYKDLKAGRPVPGKKLVAGRRGIRTYIKDKADEAEAIVEKLLGDEAYETKLRSPSQINNEVGDEVYDMIVSGFVTQTRYKPVIVDKSNPKPALASNLDILNSVSV